SSFVVFMLFMVWMATQNKVELVAKDYYKEELAYQIQIDKENRTGALEETLQWQLNGKNISLQFLRNKASEGIEAHILFYRPSDSNLDVALQVTPGMDGKCEVSTASLKKGLYLMQINWSAGGQDYYNEEHIEMP